MSSKFDWTPESIDELTKRWLAGETTPSIARVMRTTNSTIVGKAHRLKLPGRPSPILRGVQPKLARPKAPTLADLVPLAGEAEG